MKINRLPEKYVSLSTLATYFNKCPALIKLFNAIDEFLQEQAKYNCRGKYFVLIETILRE